MDKKAPLVPMEKRDARKDAMMTDDCHPLISEAKVVAPYQATSQRIHLKSRENRGFSGRMFLTLLLGCDDYETQVFLEIEALRDDLKAALVEEKACNEPHVVLEQLGQKMSRLS